MGRCGKSRSEVLILDIDSLGCSRAEQIITCRRKDNANSTRSENFPFFHIIQVEPINAPANWKRNTHSR
jgi:hypothetical protein